MNCFFNYFSFLNTNYHQQQRVPYPKKIEIFLGIRVMNVVLPHPQPPNHNCPGNVKAMRSLMLYNKMNSLHGLQIKNIWPIIHQVLHFQVKYYILKLNKKIVFRAFLVKQSKSFAKFKKIFRNQLKKKLEIKCFQLLEFFSKNALQLG